MRIESLSLKHRVPLSEKFKKMHLFISEYTFANLYLFRNLHQYEIISLNEHLFIKGVIPGLNLNRYIMLTQHPDSSYLNSLKAVQKTIGIHALYPIAQEDLICFERDLIQASFNEAESDYLFTNSKLATYAGRNLSKKRNLVRQFLNEYQVETSQLSPATINEAKGILDAWVKETGKNINETDFHACLEALDFLIQLNLEGRVIYADQIPVGFIIGEWLNDACFVIHFQKGLKNIHGCYQYALQDTAIDLNRPDSWINLEQDLGIAALRQAKHSYQPDKMVLKWHVSTKIT